MCPTKVFDCLIIGDGAAGLSAALALNRVCRSCALFSHHKHRNAGTQHIHGVLGADHIHPERFYETGKRQINRYQNTEFISTGVIEIARVDAGPQPSFIVQNAEGNTWEGRSVILATGARDIFPELEGYAENWPTNIYHCLFCDGYGRRDMDKGVLCYPSFASDHAWYLKMASMAHFMSPPKTLGTTDPSACRSKVTMFTNGPPNTDTDPELLKALDVCAAHRIHVDTRRVVKLASDPEKEGLYVHLLNGDGSHSVVHMGFLCHHPESEVAAPHLLSQLGIECTPKGFAKAGYPYQNTNVPGVFVAGDTCTDIAHVTKAMNTGMMCAAGAAHYCDALDDQLALVECAA